MGGTHAAEFSTPLKPGGKELCQAPHLWSDSLTVALLWLAKGIWHLFQPFQSLLEARDTETEVRAPFLLETQGGEEFFQERYQLGEKIGEGAFGKVYVCTRAHHPGRQTNLEQDEPLCVKVVGTKGRHAARVANLPISDKHELLAAFDALEHPHIVRYHQFLQTSSALYIVMSRCEGPDLVDHLQVSGDLLPMREVQLLAAQITSAVACVHGLGMMHRDIKAENFRFRDPAATELQLVDFGAAKLADSTAKAHTVTGTLLYAAPEVFDGIYAQSCDLWSVGVVLFLLISGQLPFETSDMTMLRSMHHDPVLTGDCLFRGVRWKKASAEVRSLVRGLLTVNPLMRLTAPAAASHPWVSTIATNRSQDDQGDSSLPRAISRDSAMSASQTSLSSVAGCMSSKTGLANLKRTYFVWDMADSVGDTANSLSADEDTDSEPCR